MRRGGCGGKQRGGFPLSLGASQHFYEFTDPGAPGPHHLGVSMGIAHAGMRDEVIGRW